MGGPPSVGWKESERRGLYVLTYTLSDRQYQNKEWSGSRFHLQRVRMGLIGTCLFPFETFMPPSRHKGE